MNIGSTLVLVGLVLVVVAIVRYMIREHLAGKHIGCEGCSSETCAGCNSCSMGTGTDTPSDCPACNMAAKVTEVSKADV